MYVWIWSLWLERYYVSKNKSLTELDLMWNYAGCVCVHITKGTMIFGILRDLMCVCMHVCMSICRNLIYVCMSICRNLVYVCIPTCRNLMYVCMYVCMSICRKSCDYVEHALVDLQILDACSMSTCRNLMHICMSICRESSDYVEHALVDLQRFCARNRE